MSHFVMLVISSVCFYFFKTHIRQLLDHVRSINFVWKQNVPQSRLNIHPATRGKPVHAMSPEERHQRSLLKVTSILKTNSKTKTT